MCPKNDCLHSDLAMSHHQSPLFLSIGSFDSKEHNVVAPLFLDSKKVDING